MRIVTYNHPMGQEYEEIDDAIVAESVFVNEAGGGVDVERFIKSLSFQECIVLVFKSMNVHNDEIQKIMGYKDAGSVRRIMFYLRKRYTKEQFYPN